MLLILSVPGVLCPGASLRPHAVYPRRIGPVTDLPLRMKGGPPGPRTVRQYTLYLASRSSPSRQTNFEPPDGALRCWVKPKYSNRDPANRATPNKIKNKYRFPLVIWTLLLFAVASLRWRRYFMLGFGLKPGLFPFSNKKISGGPRFNLGARRPSSFIPGFHGSFAPAKIPALRGGRRRARSALKCRGGRPQAARPGILFGRPGGRRPPGRQTPPPPRSAGISRRPPEPLPIFPCVSLHRSKRAAPDARRASTFPNP